jgi:hypothetical protein
LDKDRILGKFSESGKIGTGFVKGSIYQAHFGRFKGINTSSCERKGSALP